LKEEAVDRTMWRNRFRGGFGLVVRQNTERMNPIKYCTIITKTCTLQFLGTVSKPIGVSYEGHHKQRRVNVVFYKFPIYERMYNKILCSHTHTHTHTQLYYSRVPASLLYTART
jgi:hypothetical protein